MTALLTVSVSVWADWAPACVQDSLQRMYPQAEGIAWTHDGAYYVADFEHAGFDTRVWLDEGGHWQMKQTDWEVMDRVPADVFNAYALGNFSNWEVQNVTQVLFPHWLEIVVVEVGEPNLPTKYQLFYTPDGELLRERDVTNGGGELDAALFLNAQ